MDISATNNIEIKKEPSDSTNGSSDDGSSQNPASALKSESTAASAPGPLKYVSRRGRPPGGGYSMKSHPHYVRFSSLPLTTSVDLGRQLSSGQSSSLASHDLLKTGGSSSTDNLDIRRFGFPGFDSDKNSFRCDGCDVVFSSRDTYAMHMLLRAKNESCVALPTSAISSNPENPTPREKFERELRQQTMIAALRNQATAMLSKTFAHSDSLASLVRSAGAGRDESGLTGSCGTDGAFSCNNLFSLDAYGLYVDPHQYRRTLEEYGLRTSASASSLEATTEQLSCRECGEIFTGKDALAMHMMFHTRDDDKDTSPSVSWADLRSISSQKHESPWSSASSSPTQCTGTSRTSTVEQSTETKKDTNKPEEGGLTAERVVELKRMAIESSLRSTLKPTGTLRQSTRPKSVSQDAPVITSAQNRPLSADDVCRFTTSEPKTHKDLRESTLFCKDNAEDQAEKKVGNKRRFTTIQQDTSFDIKRLSADAKKRKNGYENIFYNFFYRSSKRAHLSINTQTEKDASVSDNHVSSASGPQDSDDRSEGSSATEHESGAEKDEQATAYSKIRTFPYLDAIMSQQAFLVPLDSASSKESDNETVRDRKRPPEDSQKTQSSAIDFSTRRRDNSRESVKQGSWYVPQSSHDNAGVENLSHDAGAQVSAAAAKLTRNENHGNLFSQYQNLNCTTGNLVDNQGHRLGKRQPTGSRLSTGTGSANHENESRSWTDESTSRVGEARYCPHCEILFLDVTLFHLHMGLHNVNNPWQCNTCGLVCTGRLDFNIHVLHY